MFPNGNHSNIRKLKKGLIFILSFLGSHRGKRWRKSFRWNQTHPGYPTHWVACPLTHFLRFERRCWWCTQNNWKAFCIRNKLWWDFEFSRSFLQSSTPLWKSTEFYGQRPVGKVRVVEYYELSTLFSQIFFEICSGINLSDMKHNSVPKVSSVA